jgi:hypothetical protein
MDVEEIRGRYAAILAEFRGEAPRKERIGMSVAFVRAVEDIGRLVETIDRAVERAATDYYEGIGYRQTWAELGEERRDEYRQMWREILLTSEVV